MPHANTRTTNLLADTRTYAAAGHDVARALTRAGWRVHTHIIPDPVHGDPVCDDVTLAQVRKGLVTPCDLLVAVGSGVVNDLCKWISTETDIPYMVVATAASMNGYSSENIAPSIRGVKRVLSGTVPFAIVAVPSVIAEAPFALTAAGLGDVLAKPVSMTDWKINHVLFGEYYCALCARLIRDLESLYLDNPHGVRERNPATIRALFTALIYSGIAMTMAGTSFPASGGEHLVSHVLDMTSGLNGVPHDYHGRQVGIGTILASALYERLLGLESPSFEARGEATDHTFWGALAGVVEEEHARKRRGAEQAVVRLREPGMWDRLRGIIEEGTLPASRIKHCLKEAGAAHCIGDIGCTRQRFAAAVLHSHQIRERYTVIDLARAAGLLPACLDEIIDDYLAG